MNNDITVLVKQYKLNHVHVHNEKKGALLTNKNWAVQFTTIPLLLPATEYRDHVGIAVTMTTFKLTFSLRSTNSSFNSFKYSSRRL